MRKKLGFWVCFWFWFWFLLNGLCLGKFVVEKNSLRITAPDSLKDTYECAIGNFGIPQYGGSMTGFVVYPSSNQNSCNSFNISFKSKAGGQPVFLLVDRGDCFFTLKALNAQNAGAAAILIADDTSEPLITMDIPEEVDDSKNGYVQNITIPSALISQSLGNNIKKELSLNKEMVTISLDWREALPHPDHRVEYEFWTNSNYECGPKCLNRINFVKNFKGAAQILELNGYTQFTPRYITWFCPEEFVLSNECMSQCINHGRYCAPDPEQDFTKGYDGKDVVVQNLRQACFFKIANETGKPWLWWDYVTDFSIRCPMKEGKYTRECANEVIKSLYMDVKEIDKCIGNPDADEENLILKAEQEAQIGKGPRGDVTILPTLVINNRQYRGKLDKSAVLKAICSGFQETSEPAICLSEDTETNECLQNNGGCWQDKVANITACRDTFRGRVCECPIVQGVKFMGDGYTHCEVSGALQCTINNGGCWRDTQEGKTYSACLDNNSEGCTCPLGFKGDGVHICQDIDECKEKTACTCSGCKCKNTWGSYKCSCSNNQFYMREHDKCIDVIDVNTEMNWGTIWVVVLGLAAIGIGGYTIYKYRIRSYMDSEIRAVMAQYMPLDGQAEEHNLVSRGGV